MNKVIETILDHRSIRTFTKQQLTKEQIHLIVQSAQQASTSSYVMAYSIIGITDERIKEQLANISGQPYVKDNGHLFVFCADLHRIHQLASPEEKTAIEESLETTEQFMVAIIDTALAAQNACLAAESIGLGVCYIGSLRNDINRVNKILNLPPYVIPLFGLAVGYPNEQPEKKPRLPFDLVYHENEYNNQSIYQSLQNFDKELNHYYHNRSSNVRNDTWSDQMMRKYKKLERLDVTGFVKDKNFNKR
ncbi:oxygen-insensitive NADPH nitroreductase [Ornithinibacillus sp. L9]|uniref:Oxygen-insensitive NADPH nitroreductase n=1 Tax=Ornithinibacillus caprae TaxID=2678566 RepID=A0A6N8FNY1_9BACI|nr:oxygen-insensitive NADPH nitroreductase [Ornithinibacillus caprae]MUK90254.1 oxygen-insensitive NADPH nitroreductase [Ornithinibacillus caprae]